MAKPPEQVQIMDPESTWVYLIPPQNKPITPEDIRLKNVDADGNRRLRLSPTKMVTFDACHASFRNTMIGDEEDGGTIYTSIGTAAHYVLELLNKGEKLNALEREMTFKRKLIEICSATMGKKNEIPLSFPNGYKETKETLINYKLPHNLRVFSAEMKQVLRFSQFDFSYIADVVLEDVYDGSIEIRDYKTNAKTPKTFVQLDYYTLMTLIRHPEFRKRKVRASYHMLRPDKVVYREYPEDFYETQLAILEKTIGQMGRMFRLDVFDTTPSAEACQWCPMVNCSVRYERGQDDGSFIAKAFGKGK